MLGQCLHRMPSHLITFLHHEYLLKYRSHHDLKHFLNTSRQESERLFNILTHLIPFYCEPCKFIGLVVGRSEEKNVAWIRGH